MYEIALFSLYFNSLADAGGWHWGQVNIEKIFGGEELYQILHNSSYKVPQP